MKKSLSVILAIVLVVSLFTGCDKDKKPKVESKVALTSEYDKSTELVGDSTATGELNISYWGYSDFQPEKQQIQTAINLFQKLYPNVIVKSDLVPYTTNYDDYYKNLTASIQSQGGTDVFFTNYFPDIYKLVKEGALANMGELFEKDESFNLNEYNQAVLFGNNLDGKQYLTPINYSIPLFATTKTNAKDIDFNVDQCKDFFSTTSEFVKVFEKNKKGKNLENPVAKFNYPHYFPTGIGYDFIDYDAKKVSLDSPETRKFVEEYRNSFYKLKRTYYGGPFDLSTTYDLKDKKSLFTQLNGGLDDPAGTMQMLNSFDEAVIFPWRNANGNIQANAGDCIAVSQKSPNKQNAYLFMKVMLSKEVQMLDRMGGSLSVIPVSNVAAKSYLKNKLLDDEIISGSANEDKLRQQANQFINDYMDYINQVDGIEQHSQIKYIFNDSFDPYFNNQKSYEECIADAEKKIQAYVFG